MIRSVNPNCIRIHTITYTNRCDVKAMHLK